MIPDPRCCGTGTCLINADGECWCGQRWDGEKMCRPPLLTALTALTARTALTALPISPGAPQAPANVVASSD